MAKGKVNVQICTQDLTPEQLTQLPRDVWSFLVEDVGGHAANIQKMRSPKIKSAALAFIDSGIGRSYWPHSEMGDLQSEASFAQLEAYIADMMMKRQSQQPKDENSSLNDLDMRRTPPRLSNLPKAPRTPNTPKQPTRPLSGQSKLSFASARKSPAASGSAVKRAATSKPKNFSQESYDSSTDFQGQGPDDTQYEMEGSFPVTPKRKRPFRAPVSNPRTSLEERHKANSTASVRSPQEIGGTIEAVSTYSEGWEATLGTGLKRCSADVDIHEQRTPTPRVQNQQPQKRVRRAEPISSFTVPHQDSEHEVELDRTSFTVVGSEPFVQPSESPRLSSTVPSAQPDTNATTRPGNATLFRALGGEFTADNIAKVGDFFLDYIEDCEQEHHRTAARIRDPDAKRHHLFCARNLGDLRQDLQSIAKTLTIDAVQRNRMRTDYTLKKARGENI